VNETLNAHDHSQIQGVTLFALVDHSGEAGKMGLKMPPTKAIDLWQSEGWHAVDVGFSWHCHHLPLKILIAENSQGRVWISYNSSST
jgi:uncharacterized protein (DUF302 family)